MSPLLAHAPCARLLARRGLFLLMGAIVGETSGAASEAQTTAAPTEAPTVMTASQLLAQAVELQAEVGNLAGSLRATRAKIRHLDGVVAQLALNITLASQVLVTIVDASHASQRRVGWLGEEASALERGLSNLSTVTVEAEAASSAAEHASKFISSEERNVQVRLTRTEDAMAALEPGGEQARRIGELAEGLDAYRSSVVDAVERSVSGELPSLVAAVRLALQNLSNVTQGHAAAAWQKVALGSRDRRRDAWLF